MSLELLAALSGVGTLGAMFTLASQGSGDAAAVITENTSISVGLLLAAGGALITCAWRAGRKSAAMESEIRAMRERVDLMANRIHGMDVRLTALMDRLTRHELMSGDAKK